MNLISATKKALREGKRIISPDHYSPLQFEDDVLWCELNGEKFQYSLDKDDILSKEWVVV